MQLFTPAQGVGYVAFVFGVSAFLQRSDRRLKFLVGVESLIYGAHFLLLGHPPAAAAATFSGVRSFLSLRYRSVWLAAAIISANLAVGALLIRGGTGWIPLLSSSLATAAIFTLQGVKLRLALLLCTLLWLVNNILAGSVGGMLLETVIAVTTTTTMLRLLREAPVPGPARGRSGALP